MERACWMTLKCSAEPKRRYVAQIAVFAAESEPIWLKDKIHPKGQESDFQYRAAQRYAEILVSDSRFSLCPAGCVSRYSKADREGTLITAVIQAIMSEEKANQKVRLKIPMERIQKYFPQSYTAAQIEDAVVKLCERDYRRRTDRER